MPDEVMFVFYLRPARRKARVAATAEALGLLAGIRATAPVGGPLSEEGGLFWITVPRESVAEAIARMPRLGYTYAVDMLEPVNEAQAGAVSERSHTQRSSEDERRTRWRRQPYRLVRVYEEDAAAMREAAVDRRPFLLETREGGVREVRGYRGDSGALSRRGLPVYDARLLVNLVSAGPGMLLLDPFAGTGGIVIEALASGATVLSVDIDPALRHGLAAMGSTHSVSDAAHLPFASESVDAIATEPPYHVSALPMLRTALTEMCRVLRAGGRLALLCAASQAQELRDDGTRIGLKSYIDTPINRKGLDVVVLAWEKTTPGH